MIRDERMAGISWSVSADLLHKASGEGCIELPYRVAVALHDVPYGSGQARHLPREVCPGQMRGLCDAPVACLIVVNFALDLLCVHCAMRL